MHRRSGAAWEEIVRTSIAVRAPSTAIAAPEITRLRRLARPVALCAASAALFAIGVAVLLRSPAPAAADSGADSTLFSLTNSDRSSNGVGALSFYGTLQSIGENAGYNCGVHVNGRAEDMIQRNYFSHVIQGCGQYVFSMMQAYGIRYQSAGENIGWVSNETNGNSAANYINGQFMGSPDHRSNILNGNYTDMGAGSWPTASGQTWSGGGSAQQNVWMFAEEFAQLASAPPPPPPPPPPPRPSGGGNSGGGSRNSPAPAPPAQPPATATPAPTPTPTPLPTATPIPAALLPSNIPAPPTFAYPGLLPSTVESVLESFLIV